MRIDGICACVGATYANRLARGLEVWLETLDSLTVVTKPGDPTLSLDPHPKLKFVETSVFTSYEAYFNKGAALCYAYAAADPTDWVLHIDADVVPPKNWREITEAGKVIPGNRRSPRNQQVQEEGLQPGHLYGTRRSGNDRRATYFIFHPYGFFQMWHVSDEAAWRWPIYDTFYSHAAAYDVNFIELWPANRHRELAMLLHHQGEMKKDWFGEENRELMGKLLKEGLKEHRQRVQKEIWRRLPIPAFKLEYELNRQSYTSEECQEILRAARNKGPFAVHVRFHNGEGVNPPANQIKDEINGI